MKELPRVYSNPIDKEIRNNEEIYYTDGKSDIRSPKDILAMVNEIFARKDFVYKKKVKISTFNGEEEVVLVGKNNSSLLTLDNRSIPIISITDIKVI